MVGPKVMKRKTCARNKSQVNDNNINNSKVMFLDYIPIELTTEIVALVAASSTNDLFNAKLR